MAHAQSTLRQTQSGSSSSDFGKNTHSFGSKRESGGNISPELKQLLPMLLQQLQSNPELLKQFGMGGLSGLGALGGNAGNANGIAGMGAMDVPQPSVPNVQAPVPGANAPLQVPEQAKMYRQQYHPVDINLDGRVSADEAAAYAAWMFRRHDLNGDNVLVMREFSAVEALPGPAASHRARLQVEARRLELLFPKVDLNNDKMITKEEFMTYAQKQFDAKRGDAKDINPFQFETVLPF
jgi:hypothetical protein